MRRPRETITASMLAASVRIERTVEWNIRRIVVTDDRPATVDEDFGVARGQFGIQTAPPVVFGMACLWLETTGGVTDTAAAFVAHGLSHSWLDGYKKRLEIDF